MIAQRCDAKILTALLAVGDCIYFDFGTPECAWQRPSRSELPPVHWVSPVATCAHSHGGAACKLSANNPAGAAVHADGKSAPEMDEERAPESCGETPLAGVVGCDCVSGVRLRALFRRSSGPAGDPLSQRPLSATRMGQRLAGPHRS